MSVHPAPVGDTSVGTKKTLGFYFYCSGTVPAGAREVLANQQSLFLLE